MIEGVGGRPKSFETVEDLENAIESYMEYINEERVPPTMAGLAYFLDIDRQTLYNYAKKEKYFDTIKKYRNWLFMKLEENLIIRGNGGQYS